MYRIFLSIFGLSLTLSSILLRPALFSTEARKVHEKTVEELFPHRGLAFSFHRFLQADRPLSENIVNSRSLVSFKLLYRLRNTMSSQTRYERTVPKL